MTRHVALFAAALVTVSACSTHIRYVAAPMSDPAQARRAIQQTLEEQRDKNAVAFVEVTDERFRIVKTDRGLFTIRDGAQYGTSVYYARIADIQLSKKRSVYTIRILGVDGTALMYVYAYDQETAERFIDALGTMRSLAPRS